MELRLRSSSGRLFKVQLVRADDQYVVTSWRAGNQREVGTGATAEDALLVGLQALKAVDAEQLAAEGADQWHRLQRHFYFQANPALLPVLRSAWSDAKRHVTAINIAADRLQASMAGGLAPDAWEAAEGAREAVEELRRWLRVFVDEAAEAAQSGLGSPYLEAELAPFRALIDASGVWMSAFETCEAAMSLAPSHWEFAFRVQMLGARIYWWKTAGDLADELDLVPLPYQHWEFHLTPSEAETPLNVVVTSEADGWRAVADFGEETRVGHGAAPADAIHDAVSPFGSGVLEDLVDSIDVDDQ